MTAAALVALAITGAGAVTTLLLLLAEGAEEAALSRLRRAWAWLAVHEAPVGYVLGTLLLAAAVAGMLAR